MKCKSCCGEPFNKECNETAKHCNDCKRYDKCTCPKKAFVN